MAKIGLLEILTNCGKPINSCGGGRLYQNFLLPLSGPIIDGLELKTAIYSFCLFNIKILPLLKSPDF